MKKTLFLSAMLGAALCSMAFADVTTKNVSIPSGGTIDLHAYKATEESTAENLLDGEHVVNLTMGNGATFTNGGRNCNNTSAQLGSLTLSDNNSTVNANATPGSWYGFVNYGYGTVTLTLKGGTLKKIGTGALMFANTQVADSGTLDFSEGIITFLNKDEGTYAMDGQNLKMTAASGTTLNMEKDSRLKEFVSAGTVVLSQGATLSAKKLTLSGGTVRGAGKLKLDGDGSTDNINIDMSKIAAGTTLSLYQADGTLKAASSAINANIELTNGNKAGAEWKSIEGDAYTFNGSISGNGNMIIGSAVDRAIQLTFNGDVSGWTGTLRNSAAANTMNITIGGEQTTDVNATFLHWGGKINVDVTRDATFTHELNVTSFTVGARKDVAATAAFTSGSVSLGTGASLALTGVNRNMSLTLNEGSELTLGTADNHNFNLTTSALTVNGDSTLNANLVMNRGTLTIADGAVLTMGCSVTIGEGVKVYITGSAEDIRYGHEVTIMDSVEEAITLNNALIFVNGVQQNDFSLKLTDDHRIVVAPEPATATLSLLALAGLASRRRRH